MIYDARMSLSLQDESDLTWCTLLLHRNLSPKGLRMIQSQVPVQVVRGKQRGLQSPRRRLVSWRQQPPTVRFATRRIREKSPRAPRHLPVSSTGASSVASYIVHAVGPMLRRRRTTSATSQIQTAVSIATGFTREDPTGCMKMTTASRGASNRSRGFSW